MPGKADMEDAYRFWLPSHAVRAMQPGARGAVLLDAAQRAYEPNLTATGTVVSRVQDEIAFSRTNDDIDAAPAVLVRGPGSRGSSLEHGAVTAVQLGSRSTPAHRSHRGWQDRERRVSG
jgi:hypothetical protein